MISNFSNITHDNYVNLESFVDGFNSFEESRDATR